MNLLIVAVIVVSIAVGVTFGLRALSRVLEDMSDGGPQ